MAITLTTDTGTDASADPVNDLVTYEEAAAWFRKAGFTVSASTLRRWVKQDRIPVRRRFGVHQVSFSDLLLAEARRNAPRER